jgi:CBS domain containing-hemolysin-like protein/mannitol/fructose-specific phosphotransferase system IIA component
VDLGALSFALLALIAVNAFFVLAEFAIVRVRPSRVSELVAHEARGARTLLLVQRQLDEHLGVCQIGITFASVALGVVSQRVAEVCSGPRDGGARAYVVAVALAYFVVTGAHVVLGEMLPKAVALRMADRLALRCAGPLRVARAVLFPLLWLFSAVAALVARVARLPRATDEERHTEQELRILLDRFQERGEISFRRLLFLENVFDLGQLRVRDVMRPRGQVECLDEGAPWADNLAAIRRRGFTRYPLVQRGADRPRRYVHVKDLVLEGLDADPDLAALARPLLTASEDAPLESILGEMQRRRVHAALVLGAGDAWTGLVTLEDVVEEIVGTLRDEFDAEPQARLADALTIDRVQLDVEGESPVDAVRHALARIPRERLPFPAEWIALAVEERERTAGTYMGDGIAIPHARLADLPAPFAMILRSTRGVPCAGTTERAHLLFVLLTPAGQPRVHQALLQVVARLLHESHYIRERLAHSTRAEDVLEVVRAGEQASLDSSGSGDARRRGERSTQAA